MTNLSSLPIELLDRVFDILQAQRQRAYDKRDGNGYFSANEPLLSLSLCSRSIHSIAEKHLYNTAVLETWNLPLFLRTVLASLQLRSLVRDISFAFESQDYAKDRVDGHPERNPAPSPHVPGTPPWTISNTHARRALGMLGVRAEVGAGFTVEDAASFLIASEDYGKLAYKDDGLPHVQEEATILLFLLSNLYSLRIDLPQEDEVLAGYSSDEGPEFEGFFRLKFLRGTFELADHVCTEGDSSIFRYLPAALRHLKELSIHDPYLVPGSIKSAWPPVLFWQLACMKSTFSLPELRRIEFNRCCSEDKLELVSPTSPIEEMDLSNVALPTYVIRQIAERCKALKRFRFRTPDFFSLSELEEKALPLALYYSPAMMVEALLSQKAHLEEVKVESIQRHPFIDLCDKMESWGDEEGPGDDSIFDFVRVGLQHMLKTVDLTPFNNLHAASFHITDLLGFETDFGTRLSDRLPASLQTLHLTYDPMADPDKKDSFTESFSHLSDLVDDVVSGKLPALKQVNLDLKKDWYDDRILTTIQNDARKASIDLRWTWHIVDSAYEETSGAKPGREKGASRQQWPGMMDDIARPVIEELETMDEDYGPRGSEGESSVSGAESAESGDDGPPGGLRAEDMVAPPPPALD